MATHPHEIVVPLRISTNRALSAFKVAATGLLDTIRIDTDVVQTTGVNVSIDVVKNGTVVTTLVWNSSALTHTFTGLGINVVIGDKISFVTTAGFTSFFYMGPMTYIVAFVEDGLPTYFGGTSATSFAIATGSKAFTVNSPALAYSVGARVRIASSASPTTNYMEGVVTGYTGTTLTILVDHAVGSGTHTDWLFSVAGDLGPTGATGSTGATGATGSAGANGVFSAIASQPEAEAGTENTKGMTALRTAQAIAALGGGGGGAASPWNDVIWGSTYDTFGGTTFSGVGTATVYKTNNDGTFRTGAFGSVQLTDEGIFRYILGITPNDSGSTTQGRLGFGLSHSNAMSPNGLFHYDVEYAALFGSSPELYDNGPAGVLALTASKGDIFEFRVIKDSKGVRWVTFWQNGSLLYKYATAPTMNLYLVNCLYSGGISAPTMSCKYTTFIPY